MTERLPIRRPTKLVGDVVAVDLETTGLHPWHGDTPFMVSFCDCEFNQIAFSGYVDPQRGVHWNQCQFDFIREVIRCPNIRKVFHNAEFDLRMLDVVYGLEVQGPIDDTLFMAHVANNLEPTYKLKNLAETYAEVGREDEQDLQHLVVRARSIARKLNKAVQADNLSEFLDVLKEAHARPVYDLWDAGGIQLGERVQQDYWLPTLLWPKDKTCEKYCLLDTKRTMLLWKLYQDLFEQDTTLGKIYAFEMELWPTTWRMRTRGVAVNLSEVKKEQRRCSNQMAMQLAILIKHSWPDFNPGSDPQRHKLFFEKLGFKPKTKTEKGAPQVNGSFLSDHLNCPAAVALMRYESAAKGKSSFFDIYDANAVRSRPGRLISGEARVLPPELGILHPDFLQIEARTCRYSCRQPNVQNVANALATRGNVEPIQARTPFVPRPGYVWYGFDYSQLEGRIFADFAQEPFMLEAFAKGRDLHTECGNKAWGGVDNPAAVRAAINALELLHPEPSSDAVAEVWAEFGFTAGSPGVGQIAKAWLTQFDWLIVEAEKAIGKKNTRAKAKMLLFLKIFGGGAKAASDLMGCSYREADEFLYEYDIAFPRIDAFQQEVVEEVNQNGFILTAYGRRLYVDPKKPYKGVNYRVQGSAADLLKHQTVRLMPYVSGTRLNAHPILTIHDELVLEVAKKDSHRWFLRSCKRLMEDHQGHFGIDLPVDVAKVVTNWAEKEPVEL